MVGGGGARRAAPGPGTRMLPRAVATQAGAESGIWVLFWGRSHASSSWIF